MISHKNTKLPQVLTMWLWPQFLSAIVPDVLKAVFQIHEPWSNAGMENRADPSALNLFREWLLQSLSCWNTAPLSPKHVSTQLSRYPGPQSQIQASVVQHTDDFNCIWVLIHAHVMHKLYLMSEF